MSISGLDEVIGNYLALLSSIGLREIKELRLVLVVIIGRLEQLLAES